MSWIRFPEAHPEVRICVQMMFFLKCYQEKLVKSGRGRRGN